MPEIPMATIRSENNIRNFRFIIRTFCHAIVINQFISAS
ncbi:hypothetical protein YPPY03_0859 [Yersinia pestis PY-03]|nr:hypothetical protein YPPY03_0859 [Yersinia pestis PY-03]